MDCEQYHTYSTKLYSCKFLRERSFLFYFETHIFYFVCMHDKRITSCPHEDIQMSIELNVMICFKFFFQFEK